MRKALVGLVGLSLAVGWTAATAGPATADPQPPSGPPVTQSAVRATPDELPNPEEDKRRDLRERALNEVLTGQRKAQQRSGSTVVKLGTKRASYTRAQLKLLREGRKVQTKRVDQYVELKREKTDKIFVVLAEFGNERHPDFPDRDTDPTTVGPAVYDGPVHNAIPQPDRTVDNRTIWQADYNADYYRDLYFGKGSSSVQSYYEKQSSGRYSVDGEVTDWVKVRYNEARYGRSDDDPKDANGDDPAVCASNVCGNTWNLLKDALDQWVAGQRAQGRTEAQIKSDVAEFDQWDRYDYDGDGNFNEPDGYIDHFQVVHSGGDQADGDPNQGEDAIWSHRWKAFQGTGQGPAANPDGGTQIGSTGIWVADYTIQPENGGLSVFTHEYGHDLGLPDLYDTASGGDQPMEWWSLMAQSRLKAKNDVGVGNRPGDLGAWEKMQLGWLDYEVGVAGQQKTFRLGPHEYNSDNAQALVTVLPKKNVTTKLPSPPEGQKQWWSGAGDDRNATLTRQVTLPSGNAQLSFQASYNIEDCGPDPCDYAYVQVNDGGTWTAIPGSITKAAEGNGIDGVTEGYVPATFDLSAYAGKTIGLRFRYASDGATQGNDPDQPAGIFLDDISVTSGGVSVVTDGAENGDNGWTADGFTVVGPSVTNAYPQYYIASYRSYVSYDKYLKSGPYNFGWAPSQPTRAEFFPYQDGLEVTYQDGSQNDNNVSEHPGTGKIVVIDAHPEPIYNIATGLPWRGRIQLYDATFGQQKADSFTLHTRGEPSYIRGQAARPLFDDTRQYFYPEQPLVGVKTPAVGVTLRVTKESGTSMTVRLATSKSVSPAATLASARN